MAAKEVVAFDEVTNQFKAPQSGDTYSLPRSTNVTGTLTALAVDAPTVKAGNKTPLSGEVSAKAVRFDDGTVLSTAAGNNTVPTNLATIMPNGATGNIPAGQQFGLNDNAGNRLFTIDEATGQVQDVNLAGMIGNIQAPLVCIPFKRANDETALSGVQTFTRASTATYIDPLDGLVKTAAINTPRFEKMSDGGTGILMEGTSTSLVLNSTSFVNEGSNAVGLAGVNNAGVAPDGTNTAWSVADGTGVTTYNQHNYAVPADTLQYTVSRYVKGTAGVVSLACFMNGSGTPAETARIDLSTGITTGTTVNANVQALGNGWYRLSCTVLNASVTPLVSQMQYDGTNVGVLGWGAQLEALPFATSYIPTTTAPVTRTQDHLSIPFAGNAPRIGLSYKNPMTVVFDVDLHKWNSVYQTMLSSSLNYSYLFRQFGNALYMYCGWNIITLPSVASSTGTHRLAVSIPADKTSIFGYLDGIRGAQGASTTDSVGTPSNIVFGIQASINPMFGHIRNFRIYDSALTAMEVAAA